MSRGAIQQRMPTASRPWSTASAAGWSVLEYEMKTSWAMRPLEEGTDQVARLSRAPQRGVAERARGGDIPASSTLGVPLSHGTPPLPRCGFRVAVTGHRPDRFPPEAVPAVRRRLEEAFRAIAEAVREAAARPDSGFADEAPDLVLLSGLAAGADQLAAQAALAVPGWRLHAVLPFAREEYERDFASDRASHATLDHLLRDASAITVLDGRATMPGSAERAWDAYGPLGRVLVEQCDLLLAIWDEQPGRGVGGTANVVTRARRDDVPILRVHPARPEAPILETRPAHEDDGPWVDRLRTQVATLLAPPQPAASHHGEAVDLRGEYFAERAPSRGRTSLFDLIGALFHRRAHEPSWFPRVGGVLARMVVRTRLPEPAAATREAWGDGWAEIDPVLRQAAFERFAAHHGWADALASRYAATFRATYTRVFAFAWLAVLAAFTSTAASALAGGEPARAEAIHHVAEWIEVAVLFVTLVTVLWTRRTRMHERWLDYRALAERLRHLSVLWPLGRTTPLVRLPPIATPGDPRTSWVGWYLRAVAREVGLAPGRFDARHVAGARHLLRDGELEPQRRFHEMAQRRGLAVVHPLERIAIGLFLVAFVLAAANLLGLTAPLLDGLGLAEPRRAVLLGALGVGLPALASGIHGFLGTSDLEGLAIRSAGVAPRLRELVWRLDRLDPVDLTTVGDVAVEAARVMEGELGSWRSVTAARKLQAV